MSPIKRHLPRSKGPAKRQMLSFITKDTRIPHTVSDVAVQSFFRFVTRELSAGRHYSIKGFGVFFLKHRKARVTKVFMKTKNGGGVLVEREHPEADYVHFRPYPGLKKAVWLERKPIYRLGRTPH